MMRRNETNAGIIVVIVVIVVIATAAIVAIAASAVAAGDGYEDPHEDLYVAP